MFHQWILLELIFIMIHPKVTEIETLSGSVLDLFSYEDKRYCHQISFELCWAKEKVSSS